MTDFVTGLIRTYVPIAVGVFITWVATLGVELDATTEAGLIAGLTGVLIAVYYTVVRFLAKKWPFLEVLLGSQATPTYDKS